MKIDFYHLEALPRLVGKNYCFSEIIAHAFPPWFVLTHTLMNQTNKNSAIMYGGYSLMSCFGGFCVPKNASPLFPMNVLRMGSIIFVN